MLVVVAAGGKVLVGSHGAFRSCVSHLGGVVAIEFDTIPRQQAHG
jgi:hypothetical protein